MIPSFTMIPTDNSRAPDARDVGVENKVSKPRDGFGEAYNHLAKQKSDADSPDGKAVSPEDASDVATSDDEAIGESEESGDGQATTGEETQETQPSEPVVLAIVEGEIVQTTDIKANSQSFPSTATSSEMRIASALPTDQLGQAVSLQTPESDAVEQAVIAQGTTTVGRSGTETVLTAGGLGSGNGRVPFASADPLTDLSDAEVFLTGSARSDGQTRSSSVELMPLEIKTVSPQPFGQIMKATSSMAALAAAATQAEQGTEIASLEADMSEGQTVDLFDGPTDVRLLGRSAAEGTPAPSLIWQSAAQASVLLRAEGDSKLLNAVRNDVVAEDRDGLEAVISTHEATINTVLRSNPSAVATRVDASAIMGQLSAAVQRNGAGQLEIALNPPELGRVRFAMESQDGNLVIAISADKPETMDLIRRHIDQLEKEFLELGYDSLSFNFSTPDDDQGDGSGDERGTGFRGSAPPDDGPPGQTHSNPGNGINSLVSNGQIDIRL